MQNHGPHSQKPQSIMPMLAVVFIDMVGFGIIIPLLAPLLISQSSPFVSASMGADTRVLMLGLLLASFSIAQFFGGPILGALSDKHGRKPVLLLAMGASFIGYLIFAFGIVNQSLALLFLGRILGGFVGGSISVAYSSIADLSDPKAKAKNFGLIGMAFGFGFIIGPFLGGKLADPGIVSWFNFSTPFFFTALLSLMNLALVYFKFEETLKVRSHAKISLLTGFRNIKRAFELPSLKVMFAVIFLLAFGFSFFTQFSQVFLIERFAFTQSEIGDLFAYIGIWIALTQGVLTKPVSKRFTPEQVLRFSPVLLAVSLGILLFLHDHFMLYLTMPLIAIAQGLIFPNYTAIISNLAGRESQGEIFGINQSVQSAALFMPPIISGVIAAIDFTLPIVASAFFVLCGWLVYVLFFRHRKAEVFHEV